LTTMNKTFNILVFCFLCNFLTAQISLIETTEFYENLIKSKKYKSLETDSNYIFEINSFENIEVFKYKKEESLRFFKYSNSKNNFQIVKKTSSKLRKYYLIENNNIIQELVLLNSNDTLSYRYKMNDTSFFYYYNSGLDITKKSVDKNLQDNGFYEIFIIKDSITWKGNYIQINESKISNLNCIFSEQKKNDSNSFYHYVYNNEKIYTLRIGEWLCFNKDNEIIDRKFYDYSKCLR